MVAEGAVIGKVDCIKINVTQKNDMLPCTSPCRESNFVFPGEQVAQKGELLFNPRYQLGDLSRVIDLRFGSDLVRRILVECQQTRG
jgi:hypothetical protein